MRRCASELALAVARIVGNERSYIQLARSMRSQPGTDDCADAWPMRRRHLTRADRRGETAHCAIAGRLKMILRANNWIAGARALGLWMEHLPAAWYRAAGDLVVREVACKLQVVWL